METVIGYLITSAVVAAFSIFSYATISGAISLIKNNHNDNNHNDEKEIN
jgi:hypothetical protein